MSWVGRIHPFYAKHAKAICPCFPHIWQINFEFEPSPFPTPLLVLPQPRPLFSWPKLWLWFPGPWLLAKFAEAFCTAIMLAVICYLIQFSWFNTMAWTYWIVRSYVWALFVIRVTTTSFSTGNPVKMYSIKSSWGTSYPAIASPIQIDSIFVKYSYTLIDPFLVVYISILKDIIRALEQMKREKKVKQRRRKWITKRLEFA